jgi:hypothetical protein
MKPVLFPEDPQFWFETLRTLGHAAYGGADIGEVLTTAQNIVAGDYDSWHDEWLATADRIAVTSRGSSPRCSPARRSAVCSTVSAAPCRSSATPSPTPPRR